MFLYGCTLGIITSAFVMYFLDSEKKYSKPTLQQIIKAYEESKQHTERQHAILVLCPSTKDEQKVSEFAREYYKTILQDDFYMEV